MKNYVTDYAQFIERREKQEERRLVRRKERHLKTLFHESTKENKKGVNHQKLKLKSKKASMKNI